MSFRGRSWVAASLAVMFLVCGCGKSGPAKYHVSGVVKFQGKPVTEGIVQFFSPTVGSAGVALKPDGSFDFTSVGGLEAADYQVYVSPPEQFTTPPQMGGPPMDNPKEHPNIPEKYRQAATSGLAAKVDGNKKDLAFDMQP